MKNNNMLVKLTKIADKLDQRGKEKLANLVDLVIAHCGKCGMNAKDVCPVCGHPNCDCGCDPKTGKGCKCKEQDVKDETLDKNILGWKKIVKNMTIEQLEQLIVEEAQNAAHWRTEDKFDLNAETSDKIAQVAKDELDSRAKDGGFKVVNEDLAQIGEIEVLFTGTADECLEFMRKKRYDDVTLKNPEGRFSSWVAKQEQDAKDDYDDLAGRKTKDEAHRRLQREIMRGEEPERMCPECGPVEGGRKYCSECGTKLIKMPHEQDAHDQPDEIDELIRKMEAEPFEPTLETEPTKEELDAFMGEEEEHE